VQCWLERLSVGGKGVDDTVEDGERDLGADHQSRFDQARVGVRTDRGGPDEDPRP
jgi:hypothetical protein